VISGASAALRPIEVTIPADRRVRSLPPRILVFRSTIAPPDVAERAGLLVTTPERTAVDLVGRSPRVQGLVALDALLHAEAVTITALEERARDMRGRYGGIRFAELVRLADGGAESPMESVLRLLLVDAGLPRPVAQYRVRNADGHVLARLDLAYPAHRIGIARLLAGTAEPAASR
jgi:transcriptional regulator with AbiEi antitoxin domain of type IV toxin-antitoxin system